MTLTFSWCTHEFYILISFYGAHYLKLYREIKNLNYKKKGYQNDWIGTASITKKFSIRALQNFITY